MKVDRTKRLNLNRVLEILQLRFGTQIKKVIKNKNLYMVNFICGMDRIFTRVYILQIEDEMYSGFGC